MVVPSHFTEIFNSVKVEKSFKEVALDKKLPIPDEESGLVLHEHVGTLKSLHTPTTEDSMWPTADELIVINRKALVPQEAQKWMVIRGANPIGNLKEVDIQGDEFEEAARDDMVNQSPYTPLLIDHQHTLYPNLPVGMSIKAIPTPDGMREDYALPIEDYNADLRAALMNGTVHQLSVGTLVDPRDKICSSCNKSIYSYTCGHEVNQLDERGNRVTVKIRRVARLLERSLTNVPVRLGTNLKSFFNVDKGTIIDFETVEPQPEPQTLAPPAYMAEPEDDPKKTDKVTNLGQAITEEPYFPMHQENLDPLTPEEQKIGKNLTAATINVVNTIEDSLVPEANKGLSNSDPKYNKEAMQTAPSAGTQEQELKDLPEGGDVSPPAQESTRESDSKAMEDEKAKKPEEDDDCMKAAEAKDDAKDPEKVGKKFPSDRGAGGDDQDNDADTHKSLVTHQAVIAEDSMVTIKSLVASNKALEAANKAQAEQVNKMLEAFTTVKSQLEEQAQKIEKLCELQVAMADAVKKAAETSTDELLEKMAQFKSNQSVAQANKSILGDPVSLFPSLQSR